MVFVVTCPCNPDHVFFKLGQDSYAEFMCPKCGKAYYAKSKKQGLKVDVKPKNKEHRCIAD